MAPKASTKRYLESDKFRTIRTDLLAQLQRTGTSDSYFFDLVDDYMDMWVTKCLLVEDIQRRGVMIKYDNGGGQKGFRKNDSIEQRLKVNAQMLKLLSQLGIEPNQRLGATPDDVGGEEDDKL
jgi:hypothetical protein